MPQQYNAQLIDQLATDFPRRNEPNYAWGNAISGYLMLARLRGLWNAVTDEQGYNYDLSGQGRTLTQENTPTVNQRGPLAYVDFNATNLEYYHRATEPGYEFTSYFTIWTWVYFDSPSMGRIADVFSKYLTTLNQRSYLLRKQANDAMSLIISGDGSATTAVYAATAPIISQWYFYAGVYTPSTSIKIYSGNANTGAWAVASNTTSIPAAVYNSNTELEVARAGNNTQLLDGSMALWGLAGYPMLEQTLFTMFHGARPLFSRA